MFPLARYTTVRNLSDQLVLRTPKVEGKSLTVRPGSIPSQLVAWDGFDL